MESSIEVPQPKWRVSVPSSRRRRQWRWRWWLWQRRLTRHNGEEFETMSSQQSLRWTMKNNGHHHHHGCHNILQYVHEKLVKMSSLNPIANALLLFRKRFSTDVSPHSLRLNVAIFQRRNRDETIRNVSDFRFESSTFAKFVTWKHLPQVWTTRTTLTVWKGGFRSQSIKVFPFA